jgi:RIO kinase 1
MFDQFINRGVINEVVRIIKSGKEAEIYLTVRHKEDRDIYVVGKVHLDKKHRNFKNEQVYRSGWQMVGKANQRAIDRMTKYGQQYIQKRWVMEEWNTLRTLWKAGASVPTPVTVNDGVILMSLIGTHDNPAPKLSDIELSEEGWLGAFNQVIRNVKIMIKHFLVHGDLSPFNILFWEGTVWVIDFPQTVDIEKNINGTDLLYRDLKNVCDFFARKGVNRNPGTLFKELLGMEYEEGKSYLELMVLNSN